MARIHPPTRTSVGRAVPGRRPDGSRPDTFPPLNAVVDRINRINRDEPITYRPNRNFHEDAVEAREPVGDFGGGEISQCFKALQERLMGLSNGLSVLAQRIGVVMRPEPPSNATKDTGGPSASSAVARALQQLDRNVESMQVQIDSLTERIVL